jgi:hypothetical protein
MVGRPRVLTDQEREERAKVSKLLWRQRNPDKLREAERRRALDPLWRERRKAFRRALYARKREERLANGWIPQRPGRKPRSISSQQLFFSSAVEKTQQLDDDIERNEAIA